MPKSSDRSSSHRSARPEVSLPPLPPLPFATAASLAALAPPDPALLGPVAPGTITLIRGPRGAGKSWLALAMARAVAGGTGLLGWTGRKAPALYVEAAMSQAAIGQRLRRLGPVPDMLHLLCDHPLELGDDESEARLLDHLPAEGAGLLVLDGLALLVPPGRKAGERWRAVARWLRDLRQDGFAVVVVDHARRPVLDDLADTVLTLKPTPDAEADIAFSAEITSRHALARADRAFAARLDLSGGTARWIRAALVDPALQAVADQAGGGATVRDIADTLGLSVTTAWRRLEQAKAAGLLANDKPAETGETAAPGKPAETGETTPAVGKPPETRETEPARRPGETSETAPVRKPGETGETRLARVSTAVLQRTLEKRLAARKDQASGPPAGPAILAGIGDDALLAECAARVPPERAARLKAHFASLLQRAA